MTIQVQIHWSDVEKSDALGEHIEKQIAHALRHHENRFTRVDVHVHDDKAGRRGDADKRCVIEARPAGADPLAVEDHGEEFYATVAGAAKKLERAAQHFVDRHRTH